MMEQTMTMYRGIVRDAEGKNARIVEMKCEGRTAFTVKAKKRGFRCQINHVWPTEFRKSWSEELEHDTWMFDATTKTARARYGIADGYVVETAL